MESINQYFYQLNVNELHEPTIVNDSQKKSARQFILSQNFPNPFNPTTTINYTLTKSTNISLELFDCLGRKILDIDNGYRISGTHTVNLNASTLSSGVYFYKLTTTEYSETRKLVLLK